MDEAGRDHLTAEVELTKLLSSVDLSAPSSTKFDPIREWAGKRADLPPAKVSVYWVSKPGNFDVRFRQPGVARDKPLLGLALIPTDGRLDKYLKPARRLVENGLFLAIVIFARAGDAWRVEAGFVQRGSGIEPALNAFLPAQALTVVSALGQPDKDPVEETSADPISREPSGLDPGGQIGWGDYPLDSVFVRSETRTVNEVVKRIRAGRYQLDPDFQRDFVWPLQKQSRLIESCVMRIPLPVFYLAEARDGRIIVVDGLQRLTTFWRFLDNEFALQLTMNDESSDVAAHPLAGRRFSELPISLAERIEDTQLTLYILDAKAPERAKLDIFERVNSGVPLSRQQMRNSLYNGAATNWLKVASQSEAFCQATGRSLATLTMRDREAINRFCAFYLIGWSSYLAGDMDAYLGSALDFMNGMASADFDGLSAAFDRSMKLNEALFGRHAFRKSLANEDPSSARTVINIALFDVCSVLLASVDYGRALECADSVRESFRELISDPDFNHAITYSTNSTRQVRTRFVMASSAISAALE